MTTGLVPCQGTPLALIVASLSRHLATESGQPTRPWNTGQLRALARRGCQACLGIGHQEGTTCTCVWQSVFRACYDRFRLCQQAETWGKDRRPAEYMADFELVARRVLSAAELKRFKRHFIQGDPDVAVPSHAVERVARAYRADGLFPVRAYFHGRERA